MRELVIRTTIKDCDVQTYRVSGAGGQHRDKTSAGVRIVHRASGAMGQSSDDRSQARNKRIAFRRMAESVAFQTWAQAKVRGTRPLDEVVDEQMADDNLLIEYL